MYARTYIYNCYIYEFLLAVHTNECRWPGIERWLSAFEERSSYRATKSDYYTHVMDIPPQYGPSYPVFGEKSVCMYVCMLLYVSIHCIYVCTVCMYGSMYASMFVCIYILCSRLLVYVYMCMYDN